MMLVLICRIVQSEGIVISEVARAKYGTDWTGRFQSRPQHVLLPQSTAEISRILAYCNTHNLGVVPFGGNTGLVGGTISDADGDVSRFTFLSRTTPALHLHLSCYFRSRAGSRESRTNGQDHLNRPHQYRCGCRGRRRS